MEDAFRAMLIEHAGVDDRVYPLKLPQAVTRPALTYQFITGPRDYTQDGPDGATRFRVQVDIWGTAYNQCRTVRDALAAGISGLNHESFGSPAVEILGCFIDNERDFYESALDAAGPKLFRKTLDLFVTFVHG